MIWTAILLACTVAAPTTCRTHELYLDAHMPTAAAVEAQARAAAWLALHPGLVQRRLVIVAGREA
jgi:hypothetical protein